MKNKGGAFKIGLADPLALLTSMDLASPVLTHI